MNRSQFLTQPLKIKIRVSTIKIENKFFKIPLSHLKLSNHSYIQFQHKKTSSMSTYIRLKSLEREKSFVSSL